jgi:ABC-2 type transport system ATP-binding protein
MNQLALEARGLTKIFPDDVVAVSSLDLAVDRGSVCALLGRNGSGKTTLLRMLMGLLHANTGSARILDKDMWTASRAERARVAYVSQNQRLTPWMTPEELCYYASHFYEKWDMDYARTLARRFNVSWTRQIAVMSGGEQRKAAVVLAMAARPEVLILDEPAAGLDPIARRELIDALIEALGEGAGCTVLFSTHIISDVERIADTVVIMDRGRVVTASKLEDLQSRIKKVQVVFDGERPPAGFAIPGTVRSETAGPVVTALARIESDTQLDVVRRLPGARVQVFPLGLEETFIEFLGRGGEEQQQVTPSEAAPPASGSSKILLWIVLGVLVGLLAVYFLAVPATMSAHASARSSSK